MSMYNVAKYIIYKKKKKNNNIDFHLTFAVLFGCVFQ